MLEEDGCAFGRAQKENGIDLRDVHAFIEDVDCEEAVDLALFEFSQRSIALFARVLRRDCQRRDAGFVEAAGHVTRVLDTDAKSEGAHRMDVRHLPLQFGKDLHDARVIADIDTFELRTIVGVSCPAHV